MDLVETPELPRGDERVVGRAGHVFTGAEVSMCRS